jgi:Ca-activated chloride channel homolog
MSGGAPKKSPKNFHFRVESGGVLHPTPRFQKNTTMKSLIALVILGWMMIFRTGSGVQAPFYVNGTVTNERGKSFAGVTVTLKGTSKIITTDVNGFYTIQVPDEKAKLVFSAAGYKTQEIAVGTRKIVDVKMAVETPDPAELSELATAPKNDRKIQGAYKHKMAEGASYMHQAARDYDVYHNTEAYNTIHENGFKKTGDHPLSTFSIDVDAASYSNMRRFINQGQKPPKDAVRIEELINYFNYNYKQPTGEHPFAINTEVTNAPWNDKHLLVQIGLQGKKIASENLPASNIVFLIDVSGSMDYPNKLPLLKSAFKLLTNELRAQDKVSIVVYAGAAGLVLEPTSGSDKQKIVQALDNLNAGGSTAGGAGIQLAYKVAKQNYIQGGNNRVIIATDGDFNVGESSDASMERLIEEKRKEGVFLTVLGFGMGNYKDSKMETLANKGNGNYAYIDNIQEAKKVLVTEFGGTLFTIAKDVKIQVEFNPQHVQAYRLIGYENRLLANEDFNDDQKDAGELGSGHTVTALYEIIPVGVESEFVKNIDPLKYQKQNEPVKGNFSDELLTVKFRYKAPDGDVSKLIAHTVKKDVRNAGENLQWSSAVAGFGMLLRDSEFKGNLTYDQVLAMARKSKGADEHGYRAEFIQLVELARGLRF